MTALITTVLLASLMGSLHCAGMCGAFAIFAMAPPGAERRWPLQAAYHGGRLVTYSLLGVIAGAAGAALDLGGAVLGLQRAALVLAGGAMIAFGTVTLLRLAGIRLGALAPRGPLLRLFSRVQKLALGRTPLARAGITGLASTLLPCGWLYAFAVTAAGTGSPATGAAVMGLFWAGTLPALAAVGYGAQRLAGPLRRYVPAIAALALVTVGLVAVSQRFQIPALDTSHATTDAVVGAPLCHGNGE